MKDNIEFQIEQMNSTDAEQILKWTYQEPYSIYSMDESEESLNELLNGSYYLVLDDGGNLTGYFCFGESAKVPAGNLYGAYERKDYTDIGLGIRPDLCGQGLGLRLLEQGILKRLMIVGMVRMSFLKSH